MKALDPLNQLKDVHTPDAIGWWPPAPGWWMVAILLIGIVTALCYFLGKRHRHLAYKREAQTELERIQSHFQQQADAHTVLRDLSELLKRTCITRFGRDEVAGLSGEEWLQFLDKTGNTQQFSRGVGRVLVQEKYSRHPEIDGSALIRLIQHWLGQQR